MSGWASLSGYLHLKPGGGALSILKAKKRMWCVLEESQGRLLYFKSEDDARSKPPLGYVELRGAAITLDMDNHNQFVIIVARRHLPSSQPLMGRPGVNFDRSVDNKDVLLTAENHESMMIWLMALQARRDQFTLADKSRSSSTSTENEFDIDQNFLNVVEMRERVGLDLYYLPDRGPDLYSLSDTTTLDPINRIPLSQDHSNRLAPFLKALDFDYAHSLSLNLDENRYRLLARQQQQQQNQHSDSEALKQHSLEEHRSLPQQVRPCQQNSQQLKSEGEPSTKRDWRIFNWFRVLFECRPFDCPLSELLSLPA
ncbi:TBC1 domain family member 2B [Elysia marginata]|uniref:TBC1 domain family member 2B n=1 Tax=Elysia marginata TaxID=1093978 RepID=A0AAV4F3G1_9GAST|nr:TBC1 domain family member 2B [Elysia marginata]